MIKLHRYSGKVSYIDYPEFEKVAHPPVRTRFKVSLRDLTADLFDYTEWHDPPLLFRKEELLAGDHEWFERFARLTRQEQNKGLLDGIDGQDRKSVWDLRLKNSSHTIHGHSLRTIRASTPASSRSRR